MSETQRLWQFIPKDPQLRMKGTNMKPNKVVQKPFFIIIKQQSQKMASVIHYSQVNPPALQQKTSTWPVSQNI